jgi:hypothetical protein
MAFSSQSELFFKPKGSRETELAGAYDLREALVKHVYFTQPAKNLSKGFLIPFEVKIGG